jgi:DNA-binding NtrC family response regulator
MSLRVLVVENERPVADSFGLILHAGGYDTRVAYSCEEALELLDEFRPDALITDLLMPGMSGLGLARKIWKDLPGCSVLFISGDGELLELADQFTTQTRNVKAITKPLHPKQILEFVARCGVTTDDARVSHENGRISSQAITSFPQKS